MFQDNEIPANCSLITKGRLTLLIKNDFKERLLNQGILNPQRLISSATHEDKKFEGRGLLHSILIQKSDGERMVAKRCLRGGLLRFFNNDMFWGGNRPLKEMIANTQILSKGVQTTEILAAAKQKVLGPLYRNFVFSLELKQCIDLIKYFDGLKEQPSQKRFKQKQHLFQAIARSFVTMHSKGIYHRDLHLKNILISSTNTSSAPEIYIIDFDKAILKGTLSPREKINNLLRFTRSMEKYKHKEGGITRRDEQRLLNEYFKYDKQAYVLYSKNRMRYFRYMKLRKFKWTLLDIGSNAHRKT